MWRLLCLCASTGLLGASCAVPEYADLAGITAVAAELDASLVGGGMMGGGGAGNGLLEVLDADGGRHTFDVRLTAGMTIMGMEAFGITVDDRALTLPAEGVSVDALLDVYRCEGAAAHFMIGYQFQGCSTSSASFSFDGVDAGFGIRMGGVSWIAIDLDDAGSQAGPPAPSGVDETGDPAP